MTRSSSSRPEKSALEETACRGHALNALARREHTRLELERKLGARGHTPAVIAATLDELERSGLIDSERFCESFVRSRKNRGQGPARIRRELAERGIEGHRASAAVLHVDDDWVALARAVRRRKFGAEIPHDYKDRAKQMRFLQYRGFSSEQIRAALEPDPDRES